jgi:hypothetical protein
MDTKGNWDQLVDALRDELQEKGGLIRLLNQQTETLYGRNPEANERVGEQIRTQLRLIARCVQQREFILQQTATRFLLSERASTAEIILKFPEYVHPLLEALVSEVDRLSNRMEERLRQNQDLKERLSADAAPVGSVIINPA